MSVNEQRFVRLDGEEDKDGVMTIVDTEDKQGGRTVIRGHPSDMGAVLELMRLANHGYAVEEVEKSDYRSMKRFGTCVHCGHPIAESKPHMVIKNKVHHTSHNGFGRYSAKDCRATGQNCDCYRPQFPDEPACTVCGIALVTEDFSGNPIEPYCQIVTCKGSPDYEE